VKKRLSVKVMVDAFTKLLSSRLAMRGKMITGANHTYCTLVCSCGDVYSVHCTVLRA